ncbi:MAG: hypothetical protein VXX85_02965 [Candidatus Margulisiibacteriota bacterium]|nr:hypothetical protein [Candidatus Margulisiibacteriota bacterium]
MIKKIKRYVYYLIHLPINASVLFKTILPLIERNINVNTIVASVIYLRHLNKQILLKQYKLLPR